MNEFHFIALAVYIQKILFINKLPNSTVACEPKERHIQTTIQIKNFLEKKEIHAKML